MMTDRELALRYAPHIYLDRKEPFPIEHLGYSVLRGPCRSPSFQRDFCFDNPEVAFIIEYAIYFDYDIQHMYDLEHFWVYVGHDGRVVDGESSSHGGYINCWRYNRKLEDGTHIPIYGQPGKHAFYPEGKMFLMIENYETVCGQRAGVDGLLIPPFLQGELWKDQLTDFLVCEHIRKNYMFKPTLEFERFVCRDEQYVPMDELMRIIPRRIKKMLAGLGVPRYDVLN